MKQKESNWEQIKKGLQELNVAIIHDPYSFYKRLNMITAVCVVILIGASNLILLSTSLNYLAVQIIALALDRFASGGLGYFSVANFFPLITLFFTLMVGFDFVSLYLRKDKAKFMKFTIYRFLGTTFLRLMGIEADNLVQIYEGEAR